MPKLFLIFLGIIIFISCNRKERSINPVPQPYNTKAVSLIDDIANDGELYVSTRGFSGVKSQQYKRYEWIKQSASDGLLVRLTDHKSPVVRIYAYWALRERGSDMLGSISIKHKNDTAKIDIQNGCDVSSVSVNELIR